jgi:hypothetical protein
MGAPMWIPHVGVSRGFVALLGAVVLAGAAREPRPVVSPHDSYAFGGRVIPADGGTLDGVHVVAVDARGTYEALMDSSGVFVGSIPLPLAGRVTLRVFSDSTAPRYYTSVITLDPGVLTAPSRVVLVPTHWQIRGGAFDGRDVRIDPARATARYGEGTGDWSAVDSQVAP